MNLTVTVEPRGFPSQSSTTLLPGLAATGEEPAGRTVPRRASPAPPLREFKPAEAARVVLIDDDAGTLGTLTPFFKLAGFEVAVCISGAAGLVAVRAGEAHALVTDVYLPDLTGLDVLAQVAAWGLRVPVVMMSGYTTPELTERALLAGARAFLSKPVDGDELVRTVRSAIQTGPAGPHVGDLPDSSERPSPALLELREFISLLGGAQTDGVADDVAGDQVRVELLTRLQHTLLRPDLSVVELLACGDAMRYVSSAGTQVTCSQMAAGVLKALGTVRQNRGRSYHAKTVAALARLASRDDSGLRLSQEGLAQAVGLSGSHLGRLLHEDTGLDFRTWRRAFRMRHAVRRLASTDEHVRQIAFSLGYGSGSQFTDEFHAVFGFSPRAFRAALRSPLPGRGRLDRPARP